MSIPAIVLAAGGSRRLGEPKQLVEFDGEPLLGRTLRVVRGAGAKPIFVVLGARQAEVMESISLSGAEPVIHAGWEQGIASSIKAGLQRMCERTPEAPGVLLLVCDQPRLSGSHLEALMLRFEAEHEETAVASEYVGARGVPAIFPASRFAELMALEGDTGARAILQRGEFPVIAVPFEGGDVDIDTPADLAALRSNL